MTVAYIEGGAGMARFGRAMENVEEDEEISDLIFLCVPFCDETVQHVVQMLQRRQPQFASVTISRSIALYRRHWNPMWNNWNFAA
jgi:predicted aconitase